MGYKVSFLDNAEYGAADINNRLKKYVTSGIADPFTGRSAIQRNENQRYNSSHFGKWCGARRM